MAEEKCRKVVYLVPMTSMADMVGKQREYVGINEITQIDVIE
jgi:hypothetical protein